MGRDERTKEESELKRLKEKQAKRKKTERKKPTKRLPMPKRRRREWKKQKLRDKRGWLHRRRAARSLQLLQWMLAKSCPSQRNRLKRSAKSLGTSALSHFPLMRWTLMNSRIKSTQSGTPFSHLKQINMTMNKDSWTKIMNSRSSQKDRSFSSEIRPSRRVMTPNPSQELTPQPSTCSLSMSEELTQEPMETEKSCMKEELKF